MIKEGSKHLTEEKIEEIARIRLAKSDDAGIFDAIEGYPTETDHLMECTACTKQLVDRIVVILLEEE